MDYFTYNSDIKKFEPTTSVGTDLASKAPINNPIFTGAVILPSTTSIGNVSSTELGYIDGVTSAIQSQIDLLIPKGLLAPYAGSTAPTGWLLCYGQSDLNTYTYRFLHAAISNTYGGTAFSDGVTNTAGAITTFNVPDLRGRVIAGVDNMGGTDAGRLDLANTLGTSAGTQNTTLDATQMPVHNHTITVDNTNLAHSHVWRWNETSNGANDYNPLDAGVGGQGQVMFGVDTSTGQTATYTVTTDNALGNHAHTASSGNAGGTANVTQPHSNLQPTLLLNYIIKY